MSAAVAEKLMTAEEFLELPDVEGIDRELIRGRLREWPMAYRNRTHTGTTSNLDYFLQHWRRQRPRPRGQVLVGDAGFRIRADTVVGIDIAYISADLAAITPRRVRVIAGVPLVAIEVLSPSDEHESVADKVTDLLEAGVALVWLVDPYLRKVTIHQPDGTSRVYSAGEEITCEPHLPGFRVAVADIFED